MKADLILILVAIQGIANIFIGGKEMTAYTVQELINILQTMPSNAEIEINGHQGIDIFLADIDNVVCIDNPY